MTFRDITESDSPLWLDSEAGPVVRPYAVTRGQQHESHADLDLLTFITTVPGVELSADGLLPEHRAILEKTREPISLAELASSLDLAVGVVRLLLGDLIDGSFVSTHDSLSGVDQPESHVLKAVIHGLRSL